jgi:hypothetical protein
LPIRNYPTEQPIDGTTTAGGHSGTAQNLIDTLPSDDSLKINWLGSSYSGADIKVVAHLYEKVNADEEEALIKNEIIELRALSDAYVAITNLASSIVESLKSNSAHEVASNLIGDLYGNAATVYVVGQIASFLNAFAVRYPSDVRRASEIAIAADANSDFYKSTADELDNQVSKLVEIRQSASTTVTLATLQTISIQSHRQKSPVRALGMSNVKGWVRGYRTIAGSMIFTMFNEHALAELIRAIGSSKNKYGDPDVAGQEDVSMLLADQLPPIDLTIVFANEYGSLSRASVYGVEFMNDGYTLSVEDLLTEEVINFVARDVDPVISVGHIGLHKNQRGMHFDREGKPTDGSKLLFTSKASYDEYLVKLGVRRGLRNM